MHRASIDWLESRTLMSHTLVEGVLTITGTEARDIIHVNLTEEHVAFGIVGGPGNGVPREDVRLVIVRGLADDDWLLVDDGSAEDGEPAFNIPLVLDGGAGDDLLARGPRATTPAVFLGGPGNDTINGGAGTDIAYGGTGDDTLNGGAGNDILSGGPGNDTLDGGSGRNILREGGPSPLIPSRRGLWSD